MLAALSHPCFKANWMEDPVEKQDAIWKLKELLNDAATPVVEKSSASLSEDFLLFDENNSSKQEEVDFYLRDPEKDIAMLDRYPQIKNIFLKYNTPIPTSAPVERLFSQAAVVLTVRLNRLSDLLLEMLILLKISFNM